MRTLRTRYVELCAAGVTELRSLRIFVLALWALHTGSHFLCPSFSSGCWLFFFRVFLFRLLTRMEKASKV